MAAAIGEPDAASVPRIWGFIDGTTIAIARASRHDQRMVHSGHKVKHCIKYQGLVTPDGLCSSLAGPTLAKDGDWWLYRRSSIDGHLQRVLEDADGHAGLYIFADSAYHDGFGMFGALSRPPRDELTPEQAAFKVRMSSKRIAVEHFFGIVTKY